MSSEKKSKKPFQVQVSFPKSVETKLLPSTFTLQPDVKPEVLSGFVNRLLFDRTFLQEYAKDPIKYLTEMGIKVNPRLEGELSKIDIKAEFEKMRPDEGPQAAAAVVAVIVVILVVSPPKPLG